MRTLIRLVFLLLLLSGCRDEFTFSVPPEVKFRYNIQSELSPQNIISIQLLETIPIGDQLQNLDRQDALALFSGPDVPSGQIEMAFNATSEKYHLIREDFRVKVGSKYETIIVIPGAEDTIRAYTFIPKPTNFDAEIRGLTKIEGDDKSSIWQIEIIAELEEPASRPAYYRFDPYRLVSIKKSNPSSVTHTATKRELIIVDVFNNNNAIEQFAQGGGITIDESRLTSNQLHLILQTKEPLLDGPSVNPDDGIEIIQKFHIELITMSPELYEYEKWVDGVVRQGVTSSSPSREIGNIENASGFFGGSSRSISFPEIK